MRAFAVLVLLLVACPKDAAVTEPKSDVVAPPIAATEPVSLTLHGRTLVDPYAWLRNREDPRTVEYLEAENRYADAVLKPHAALHSAIVEEMKARILPDDVEVPVRHGPYEYVTREVAGGEYWVAERVEIATGKKQIVLDANARSAGHEYYEVGGYDISPNHRLLAFGEDTRGDERYHVYVMDIDSGKIVAELAEPSGPSMAWGGDSKTLWTTRLDDANREHELWRNVPGTATAPVLSHREDDARFSVGIARSRDDKWLALGISSSVTSEARLIDANRPTDTWWIVEPRKQGVLYDIAIHGERLLMLTNESSPLFEVRESAITKKRTGHGPWKLLMKPGAGEAYTGIDAFKQHIVVSGRAGGFVQVWIHPTDGSEPHAIAWPDAAYSAGLGENAEFDTTTLRVGYSSPVTPMSTYDYAIDARKLELRKREEVPNFDPTQFEVVRTEAKAADGVAIPITIVRRKDAPRPGPLVLQGYGAYGSSWDPAFSRGGLPLLDRGVAIATAHIRGGGEFGKPWHDAGKLAAKPTSFTDFISVAEHLVAQGDTTAQQLAIEGGSAGGLLVGAVVNMRPDLFAAAVAEVPFVDVINTMRDETLPLTAGEWEEWGNPANAKDFEVMIAYSPYDNVTAKDYPAMLVTAGFNDPRVGYWEPAKWVAKLRATKTGDAPLLLRTEMGSGHGGASGRYAGLADQAWVMVFLLDRLGRAK
jgi:oligopeptidase B